MQVYSLRKMDDDINYCKLFMFYLLFLILCQYCT